MHVWNVLHAARWNKGHKNYAKNRHLRTIAQIVGLYLRNLGTYRQSEKLVKQQYLFHMSASYAELWPTNGWDRLVSLAHPSKFQRGSRLGFVTAATSLNGGQPNFARCLTVCWADILYIHFRRLLTLTEFCQVQRSHGVQVLRSPILPALLHYTVYATYIPQGGHHVGHRPTF